MEFNTSPISLLPWTESPKHNNQMSGVVRRHTYWKWQKEGGQQTINASDWMWHIPLVMPAISWIWNVMVECLENVIHNSSLCHQDFDSVTSPVMHDQGHIMSFANSTLHLRLNFEDSSLTHCFCHNYDIHEARVLTNEGGVLIVVNHYTWNVLLVIKACKSLADDDPINALSVWIYHISLTHGRKHLHFIQQYDAMSHLDFVMSFGSSIMHDSSSCT